MINNGITAYKSYSPFIASGPFFMALTIILISAISIIVNNIRKIKKVICTELVCNLEIAAPTGNIS
jgi:hypothetical protein